MNPEEEKRNFARVQVPGRVLFRPLDEEEVQELEERLKYLEMASRLERPVEAGTPFEIKVLEKLDQIESRLEAVLDLLTREGEDDRRAPLKKAELMNLSASGLFFLTKEKGGLTPEDRLEVRVSPQGFTGPPVTALARIIHLSREGAEGTLAVGVCFETIAEPEQERLVSFTFSRMRREIQAQQQRKQAE